jgi:NAD(P)-dependent dehydrogenase (short-subunit alcohol dehydrogenase family)
MSLKGKTVAITGGAQGIGLATAKLLGSRGANVSIADSNPSTLAIVEEEFTRQGWPIYTASVDIRRSDLVDEWIAATVQKFGALEGAVNAAGTVGKYYGQKPLAEQDEDDWNLVMDINVKGKSSLHLSVFPTFILRL